MKHLWVGDAPPFAYLELLLCRDVYHCTPSMLKREPLSDIMAHLICISVEQEVMAAKRRG